MACIREACCVVMKCPFPLHFQEEGVWLTKLGLNPCHRKYYRSQSRLAFFCSDLGGFDDHRRFTSKYLLISSCPQSAFIVTPYVRGNRGNGYSAQRGLQPNSSARCPSQTHELRWPNVPCEAMDHFYCTRPPLLHFCFTI